MYTIFDSSWINYKGETLSNTFVLILTHVIENAHKLKKMFISNWVILYIIDFNLNQVWLKFQ